MFHLREPYIVRLGSSKHSGQSSVRVGLDLPIWSVVGRPDLPPEDKDSADDLSPDLSKLRVGGIARIYVRNALTGVLVPVSLRVDARADFPVVGSGWTGVVVATPGDGSVPAPAIGDGFSIVDAAIAKVLLTEPVAAPPPPPPPKPEEKKPAEEKKKAEEKATDTKSLLIGAGIAVAIVFGLWGFYRAVVV